MHSAICDLLLCIQNVGPSKVHVPGEPTFYSLSFSFNYFSPKRGFPRVFNLAWAPNRVRPKGVFKNRNRIQDFPNTQFRFLLPDTEYISGIPFPVNPELEFQILVPA